MSWSNEQAERDEIYQFIRAETACLNRGDLDSWIALFADDGYYWMPLEEEHADPEQHDSLIYDNRPLMEIRKHNYASPLSPSMQVKVKSVRILSDIEIELNHAAGDIAEVSAYVIAVIYQQQKHYYAGRVVYQLIKDDGAIRIKVKRVDILDADAPLDCIMMYI